jgi:glutaredoxin
MDTIIIYTNETCPYCKQIKKELNKENIEFNERLTEDWPANWQDATSLTNMATVPTIKCHDEYFLPGRDFGNPSQLINILKNFKKSKHSKSKRTFEKLKTLNYNMSIAFNRIDQLLKQIETKININETNE